MIGTHVSLQLKAVAIFIGASSGYVFVFDLCHSLFASSTNEIKTK